MQKQKVSQNQVMTLGFSNENSQSLCLVFYAKL